MKDGDTDILYLWTGVLLVIILSKFIYKFSVTSITISIFFFFVEKESFNQIYMEFQGTQKSQNNFEKEQGWKSYTSRLQSDKAAII